MKSNVSLESIEANASSFGVPLSYAARLRAAETAGRPLLEAARPLLQALRDTPAALEPNAVFARRQWLLNEARMFERVCSGLRVPRTEADNARYCLCSALDEAAMQTAWGRGASADSEWSANGIATTLGYDRQGADRVFTLIDEASRAPTAYGDLLAVLQQIIASGFKGRHRFTSDGAAKLKAVRARLGVAEASQANRAHSQAQKRDTDKREAHEATPAPEKPAHTPTHNEAPRFSAKEAAVDVAFAMKRAPQAAAVQRHTNRIAWFVAGVLAAALLGASGLAAWRYTHNDAASAEAQSLGALAKSIESELPHEVANHAIALDENADRTALAIHVEGMFAPGKAVLTPSAETAIAAIGKAIATAETHLRVHLIGYTDNVPAESKTGLSNEALSTLRAQTVMKQLADAGVALDRVSVNGSGESSPLDDNHTLAGRARNRRVEIVVEKAH